MTTRDTTVNVKIPADRIAQPSRWRSVGRMFGTLWANGKARMLVCVPYGTVGSRTTRAPR